MTEIRLLLFLFSFFGYILWGKKKWGIVAEFLPALFCALISISIFLAGLLNILVPVAVVLGVLGLVLVYQYRNGICLLTRREIAVLSVFFLCMGYMWVLFRGEIFSNYDNFSHWGTVVRVMLRDGRLPNFQDRFIHHNTYPMGTAFVLYYFCILIGQTEAIMMFAQQFMQMAFLISLCALINKNNIIFGGISFLFYAMYATVSNISPYALLVDTVMPAAAVALCAMLVKYKDQSLEASICAALMLTLLLNIKNSGIFFYVGCLIFLVYLLSVYDRKNLFRSVTFAGGIPLIVFFLWKRHVDFAYGSTVSYRHSLYINNFSSNFSDKGIEGCKAVIGDYVKRVFSYSSNEFPYLKVLFVGVLFFAGVILCMLITKQLNKSVTRIVKREIEIVFGIFILYHIGMLGMYIFSMPQVEASSLAGFIRYHKTIEMFLYGILLCMGLQIHTVVSMNALSLVLLTLLFCVPIKPYDYQIKDSLSLHRPESEKLLYHEKLVEAKKCADIPEKKKYIVYTRATDLLGYIKYMLRYEFLSDSVYATDDIVKFEENAPEYEYWIIWDDYEVLKESSIFDGKMVREVGKSYVCMPE